MQKTQLELFREILQRKLAILENLPRTLDEIAIENQPDLVDAAQHAADRELAIYRLEHESTMARNIKAALERMDEGTFGSCIRCEEEISQKRMNAMPWAAFCVNCQELADREAAGTNEWAASMTKWPS